MAYTVFARKYRPQTFEDLVGQEHVAQTLGGALESDRVAHAFLFTGVRGVGKTTTARLLAKALCCEKGPTKKPCNECAICKDITAGVDMDVLEIDGASNNGVDDVRRLQESLPYRPTRDRFKVVIVDEVHMLSTGAFNAFLKTLEEPPPHVKFIFATTEVHKVPVTIRSRCQRYDFRLIPQRKIVDCLRGILSAEKIESDDAAIGIVAREAAGSMRDALTLLDQLVAFGGDGLTGEAVAAALGIAGRSAVHACATAMLGGDGKTVLAHIDALSTMGVNPLHLTKQLLSYVRDLVVLQMTGGEYVDLIAEEREQGKALAEQHELAELQRAFSAMSRLVDDVARAGAPKLVLEMGLLRIASRPRLKDLGEILARLGELERQLASGKRKKDARSSQTRKSVSLPTARTPEKLAEAFAPPSSLPKIPSPKNTAVQAVAPIRNTTTSAVKSAPPVVTPPAVDIPPAVDTLPAVDTPLAVDTRPAVKAREQGKNAPSDSGDVPILRAALLEWERIVGNLSEAKPALAAILEHGVPRTVSANKIVLSFKEGSFYGRQANAPEARAAIAQAAEKVLSAVPVVEVRMDADSGSTARTVAAVSKERKKADLSKKKKEAMEHPLVQDVMEIFPATRGSVEVKLEGE